MMDREDISLDTEIVNRLIELVELEEEDRVEEWMLVELAYYES